ncbi:60 kDa chaperonin 3 domain protein (plasmid) [Sphingobium sp. RAC03]|nr:60 kDa chaperonin 3 domain protein [Sphingobium sp. RAC03]
MPLSSLRFRRYHQRDNRNALPRSRERSCASGRAKKATIDKDNTTVIDGVGIKADIEARIARMRQQIETTTTEYDSETLQGQLAKLAGDVTVNRVGGATQF